jgi:O-antigen/teichoic acid export membrane protein
MAVRRALALSFLAANAATLVSFVSAMVIARLLTPAEIGVYSVAAALVAVLHQIRSFGIANYLVQEIELTHDRIRTAFGCLLATSWTLALVVLAASFPAAAFYGDPGVAAVMKVLALNFLLAPFGGVAMALLLRDMRFGARAVLEVSSAFALAGTSIALALRGFAYMSLAWGSLAGIVVGIIVANAYRPAGLPWLPSFRDARRVIGYGAPSMLGDIVHSLRVNTPELIVGRALGLEPVAFFNRAKSLTGQFYGLIGQAVQKVAFPYFAQERREGRDIKPAYLTTVAYFTGLGWPFFGVLALLAEPAVLLLFGDQWEASVPLTRIACLAAAINLPWSMLANVANAMGQPRVTMRVELQLLFATFVLVALASTASITAVAWSLCGVSALHGLLVARALRGLIDVRFRDCSGDLLKSAGVGLISVIAALPGWLLVPRALGEAGQLAAGLGAAGVGWLIAIVWLRHPLIRELPRATAVLRSWWLRP